MGGLINAITYVLRKPDNLHIVRWNGRKNWWSKS